MYTITGRWGWEVKIWRQTSSDKFSFLFVFSVLTPGFDQEIKAYRGIVSWVQAAETSKGISPFDYHTRKRDPFKPQSRWKILFSSSFSPTHPEASTSCWTLVAATEAKVSKTLRDNPSSLDKGTRKQSLCSVCGIPVILFSLFSWCFSLRALNYEPIQVAKTLRELHSSTQRNRLKGSLGFIECGEFTDLESGSSKSVCELI